MPTKEDQVVVAGTQKLYLKATRMTEGVDAARSPDEHRSLPRRATIFRAAFIMICLMGSVCGSPLLKTSPCILQRCHRLQATVTLAQSGYGSWSTLRPNKRCIKKAMRLRHLIDIFEEASVLRKGRLLRASQSDMNSLDKS